MKTFWSVLLSLVALLTAAVGALLIFDKIKNKNRIKGEYLDCTDEEIEETEE